MTILYIFLYTYDFRLINIFKKVGNSLIHFDPRSDYIVVEGYNIYRVKLQIKLESNNK